MRTTTPCLFQRTGFLVQSALELHSQKTPGGFSVGLEEGLRIRAPSAGPEPALRDLAAGNAFLVLLLLLLQLQQLTMAA